MGEELSCLMELAARGCDKRFIKVSTTEMGEAIGKSQQTASRLMGFMEDRGLIERRMEGKGKEVRITPKGMSRLIETCHLLSRIFEGRVIEGRVFTGVGEGRYYISREGYRSQFREKLGFDPFPGTLNLRVSPSVVEDLSSRDAVSIEKFQTGDRSFGGGRCYPVDIESGVRGAIFLPERTHYPRDVLEVISPQNLRETLDLDDGDMVRLTLLPLS